MQNTCRACYCYVNCFGNNTPLKGYIYNMAGNNEKELLVNVSLNINNNPFIGPNTRFWQSFIPFFNKNTTAGALYRIFFVISHRVTTIQQII